MSKRPAIPSTGTRWVAAFDTHGDQADLSALEALHSFCSIWKPTVRVCGGDHFDMRWLRAGAGDDERREDVLADLEAGCEFLERFKPTQFLVGNHDHRLYRASSCGTGNLRALADSMLDRIAVTAKGCEFHRYNVRDGVYRLGDLAFIHGFSAGITAVRNAALAYGNVAMGHLHRIERVAVDRHESAVGYCGGCLCKLTMDYAAAQMGTMKWDHGFMYGCLLPTGQNVVFQARKTGGKWLLPTEMICLD